MANAPLCIHNLVEIACENVPMKVKNSISNLGCPCGGAKYETCCEPYLLGLPAPTPEKLMRSRYSAYAMENEPYLLATWHPDTRPEEKLFQESPAPQWVNLKIKKSAINEDKVSGEVEFVATFKINGKAHRIHEISQFALEDEKWLYVDGTFPELK
jgi:SEC-C motif-containing protein